MPGRNHHEKPYDAGTMEKLNFYRGYVEAWLPVFLLQHHIIQAINIFDFFAGPGSDSEGKSGSPKIAFDEVTKALASSKAETIPPIRMYFNEFDPEKHSDLDSPLKVRKMAS